MRMFKTGNIFLFIVFLLLAGCSGNTSQPEKKHEKNEMLETKKSSTKLVEDRRIYDLDKDDPIVNLYVTVFYSHDGKPTTFYEMNHWYDFNSIKTDSPAMDVIVQEGNEKGPGKGDVVYKQGFPNSTFEVRGASNRLGTQKSYKIKLLDSAGFWHGQRTINLNKHSYDSTRLRNKLSFDYFKVIPNMTSLRTQFVHLHIKDLTGKRPDKKFVDYGLFTHVEQVNERFLSSHGLDPNGNLYKASNFEFFRYPDSLMLSSDRNYNKKKFESILEIKGNEDHTKLLKMLDDVNNSSLNINDVVDHYFDRDNYLTWVATNILFGNSDTNTQNFYLYSPQNSDKWYFLPWDYDGAWDYYNDNAKNKKYFAKWQSGISMYWGTVLHKRFFKDENNIKQLNEKIEDLSKIITKQQTEKLLNEYYPIVKPFITRAPDRDNLQIKAMNYDALIKKLPGIPEKNKLAYYKNLENPMPIFLSEEKLGTGNYKFLWDYSFDIQGDELSYDFQLSQDPYFTKLINQKLNLKVTNFAVSHLQPGRYFWRVVVKDIKNNKQIAFDNYENEDGIIFHGVKELIVR